MTLQPFTKEQVNYFIFAHIVTNEFPKALRQSFKYLWDTTYGHRPGYRSWDDSKEVREMFLREEGSTTDVPTNLSYTEWDCSKLFQATIYSQSFSEEDSEGRKTSLSDKYVKPHRLAEGELLTSIGKSSTSVTETFTIAINQLRILRDNLLRLTKAEIDTKTFGSYIQLSEKAFGFLNVATASIKAISSYSDDDFPTEKARKIGEDIMNYMGTESGHIRDKILKGCEVLAAESLHITEERNKELLERIIEIFVNREKVVHKLFELIKSGASPSDTGDFEPVSEKISETENEKRWSVTVIALQKILFQHIRPHVKQRMLQIYGEESYVEDCKKILRKRSGHYYGDIKSFDEFDLGAILKLLSDFDSPSHCPGAIGVIDVRNNLAHADYNQWDKAKLDKSFRAMEKLVTEMRLPGEDQRELLESLRYLEEKGEMLLSNYGAKTSLENQVKQLRDDVNDKLEYVGTSLVSIASVLREEKKLDQQLIEGEPKLTEDTSSEGLGEMLLSNYDAKTSLENQVKQLRDDVNDKLEYVRASLVSIASVVRDEKKPDQQLIEGETKLTEDTSSERLEKSLSRSKIGEVKDSTSLEEVISVLKGKQPTEEQRGEDESESFEETLDENQATSPSTIDKGKDSTSPEEVISVPMDKQQTEEQSREDESEPFKETLSVGPETSLSHSKIGEVKDPTSLEEVTSVPNDKQQTEEQSGEDESDSFEETLGENQAISPSAIDKGKDPASLEEVISVPMEKQQTEEQSGEDESESFEITLSVGPATSPSTIDKGKDSTSLEEVISVPVDKQQTEGQSGEDESESFKETLSMGSVLPELNTNMTFEPFTKERVNYFKFANIVVNEFPKALRQSFEHLWNTTYGQKPGYRIWDDSEEVRKMFLHEEGGTTDVPTDLSYTEWDCSNLFRATIFSQSFSEEDNTGWRTSLSEKYVKSRPHRSAEGELFTSGKSGTSVTETFTKAINQLRILRNTLLNLPKAEIDTKEFEIYIQLSEKAFDILNVATASIKAISSYSEDDFPTERADKIKEDIMNDMRAELKFLEKEEVERRKKLTEMRDLHGKIERIEGFLKRMMVTLKEGQEGLYELLELIESGERLLSDYAEQTSLKYQVKQLREKWLKNVRPSASVLEDKKLDQQLIEGETKLPEDASSESLETSLSRLKIGEVKDSTSLEEVTSVLKDKQQTEKQSVEGESELFKETLSENQATSPFMIDKEKDSTSVEEVVSVPLDKQQTERQSGEDESESFKETISVGPGAQDHDIKEKTRTFEAEHEECIRVLPYRYPSGRVHVHLYVFCDKNFIPKELKDDAQEFFGETDVTLKWSNMKNYAFQKPNIVSVDVKQLEVSQVNDISKIINKNLPLFSKHRNITAIQPSLKVTNSKQTNDPCIRVYVLGKGRIPFGESEIPNSVDDCPVDIVNGFWFETFDTPRPLTAHKQKEYLRLGASIGVRGKKSAGTLGAIVKDRDGGLYLLSCDHVIKDEGESRITNPGWIHFLALIKKHMSNYRNRISSMFLRIFALHPQPGNNFTQLRSQVDSACKTLSSLLDPTLKEYEDKLIKLSSKPPRTVAYYVDGIREDVKFSDGSTNYIDVAIAKLTEEEEEALKKIGYVEIIGTANCPNDDFTEDETQNEREWCKSGSSTGYTSLKSSFSFDKAFLRISEHERPSFSLRNLVLPRGDEGDDLWLRNCILLPHNGNLFSFFGDSGAVIFEKSEQHPQAMLQAMPGFGIVIGGLFSEDSCVGTIAVPLRVALEQLSIKLEDSFKLVSRW